MYQLPNDVLTKPVENADGPKPSVVKLRGMRGVNATEPEGNARILEGTTKAFTGGDAITAAAKFKDPITFTPQFVLVLQCNNVPHLNTLTNGSVRRIRLVPFPFQFRDTPNPANADERKGDAQVKIKAKSEEWRDEFILMLLEKYASVKGLATIPQPPLVKEKTDEYIGDNNPVGAWFKTHYEIPSDPAERVDEAGQQIFVKARELWDEYKCHSGVRISDKAFKQCMEYNGWYSKQGTITGKNKGIMCYFGWKRIVEPSEEKKEE
jgi:phage/plasmid-associated DNA primase